MYDFDALFASIESRFSKISWDSKDLMFRFTCRDLDNNVFYCSDMSRSTIEEDIMFKKVYMSLQQYMKDRYLEISDEDWNDIFTYINAHLGAMDWKNQVKDCVTLVCHAASKK